MLQNLGGSSSEDTETQQGQRPVHTLRGHESGAFSVAFSPEGDPVATGSYDDTVKLWLVSDGEEVRTLHEHEERTTTRVPSVTFSPGGDLVATGSLTGTAKLWDVPQDRRRTGN